jgi:hypothetical protein
VNDGGVYDFEEISDDKSYQNWYKSNHHQKSDKSD